MAARPTAPAVAVIIGLIGVLHLSHQPRFQAYRTVDIIQLIASGMCFGVALIWIIQRLRPDHG